MGAIYSPSRCLYKEAKKIEENFVLFSLPVHSLLFFLFLSLLFSLSPSLSSLPLSLPFCCTVLPCRPLQPRHASVPLCRVPAPRPVRRLPSPSFPTASTTPSLAGDHTPCPLKPPAPPPSSLTPFPSPPPLVYLSVSLCSSSPQAIFPTPPKAIACHRRPRSASNPADATSPAHAVTDTTRSNHLRPSLRRRPNALLSYSRPNPRVRRFLPTAAASRPPTATGQQISAAPTVRLPSPSPVFAASAGIGQKNAPGNCSLQALESVRDEAGSHCRFRSRVEPAALLLALALNRSRPGPVRFRRPSAWSGRFSGLPVHSRPVQGVIGKPTSGAI